MVVSPCYVLLVFCGQGDKAQDSIHVRFPKTGSKGLTPRPFFISAGRIYIPFVYPAFRSSQISSTKLVSACAGTDIAQQAISFYYEGNLVMSAPPPNGRRDIRCGQTPVAAMPAESDAERSRLPQQQTGGAEGEE